jgi:two-component system OmpR family response regulator
MLEDDPDLSQLVGQYLSKYFFVDSVSDIADAKEYLSQFNYDVVLLDRNIYGYDIGLNLIKDVKTKNSSTGVIIISAYDSISDKIEGLNMGADDYLDKPFDNDELLARIYALSRRNQPIEDIEIESLTLNIRDKTIKYDGDELILTRKENELFFYILQKRGQVVSKDELLDALYLNPQNISSNTIDVTIRNIRKKLPVPIIKTLKTRGYIIE